jgi:hypothetical protein
MTIMLFYKVNRPLYSDFIIFVLQLLIIVHEDYDELYLRHKHDVQTQAVTEAVQDALGVETTYREHNLSLPRTKSKNYVVRLLYYAVAVCIYNA